MKVARTVLNGESGSNAADLHNTILGNVVPMRTRTDLLGNTSPKEQSKDSNYYEEVIQYYVFIGIVALIYILQQ